VFLQPSARERFCWSKMQTGGCTTTGLDAGIHASFAVMGRKLPGLCKRPSKCLFRLVVLELKYK